MEVEQASILSKAKTWQNLFGVRRGNFRAYRGFCQRRSKKLRKSLRLSFGKRFLKEKFDSGLLTPKEIEKIDRAQSNKLMEILLLLAEKNYIVYMESKQPSSQLKKRTVKKKLQNALRYIDVLQNSYGSFLNPRGTLELATYRSSVAAALYLERRSFAAAKDEYLKLSAILKQLIEISAAIEKAQLEELLEAAKQSLRYCRFHLKEFDTGEERDATIIRDYEDLREMLDKVSDGANSSGKKVLIFGKSFEIDDAKILSIFQKDDLLKSGLKNEINSENSEQIFWEIVNNYEEGIRICHKNRIDAGNNASLAKLWNTLDDFFSFQKDLMLLKRNMRMFFQYEKKFDDGSNKKNEERRPQESIKQLETLLAHLRKLIEINSKFERQNLAFSQLELFLRIKKCFFICQLYYNNKCFKECLSLDEQQIAQLQELSIQLRVQNDKISNDIQTVDTEFNSGPEYKLSDIATACFQEIDSLHNRLLLQARQAKVGLFDESQSMLRELGQGIGELEIEGNYEKSHNINCLLDLVVENRESDVQDQMDFIKIPPVASLINSKPIFLDLAWNFIEYPDIPLDMLQEPKKQSKGLFGLFGRK